MALDSPAYTLACFARFEMPGGDVRLCDGGVLSFGGDVYAASDPVWGSVAEIPPVEAMIGDMAPGGALALSPDPEAPISVLKNEAVNGARVQAWLGEVDPATGLVADATRLGDWIVDFVKVRLGRGARTIVLELITLAEWLFLANRGNVLSSRFHKSIWPGERGCDNCTDIEVSVPWGTEAAPSGKAGSGGTVPGGGGRSWLDALRR